MPIEGFRGYAPGTPPPAAPAGNALGNAIANTGVTVARSLAGGKQTPAYKQAVAAVYHAQPPAQKAAILKGAQQKPTSPEAQIIRQLVSGKGVTGQGLLSAAQRTPSIADEMFKNGPITGPAHLVSSGGGLADRAAILAGLVDPAANASKILADVPKVAKNAASDLVNLPGNTVQGLAGLAGQIGQGHVGNAFHMLVDPYVQMFMHPGKTFTEHPLNSALMFAGPETGVLRGAGAVARSGALGERVAEAASTARAPLRLGPDVAGAPSPIIEHRSYSPNVLHKGIQVAGEKRLAAKKLDANVARPAPRGTPAWLANSLNVGLEAKTRRIPDEMTAGRQSGGREARSTAIKAIQENRPPRQVQNVVSHILQGVIRAPETATADIAKEIDRLKAAQTGRRIAAEIQNRTQVRDLSTALQHPELLSHAFESAARIREWQNALDAYTVRHGLLEPDQAMRSKLFPYAQAHMDARWDPEYGLVNANHPAGLPNAAILKHLEHSGVPDPAYVGHYPGKVAPWRFYQTYRNARGSLKTMPRTGEAFRQGNYDHTFNGLVAQAARTAEAATKAGFHDRIVSRLGIMKPPALRKQGENGYFTPGEARRYAHAAAHGDHGNPIPGAQRLVPVTAAPQHSLDLVKDLQHPSEVRHVSGLDLQALDRAVNDAATRKDGTRNVVLVPEHAVDQFRQQFAPSGRLERKVGSITQQFRRTVLPYSTHWMTQIGSEAAMRGVVAGALDPRNLAAGRQLMHELQRDETGRAALREMVNAAFFNQHDNLSRFNPNPSRLSTAAHAFPPTSAILKAHNMYADRVGSAMYHLEHEFRVMGLGKLARQQVQEFTGSYQAGLKLQAQNLSHLAQHLRTDPALVAKFGRQVDDIFGKYNKFSPRVRTAVQTVMPFLPWYLNAAKFVLWNLPVKHPVASSLLASLRQTINQDVQDGKQLPLNQFQEEAIAKFVPFGIFNPPEDQKLGGVLGAAADQASSFVLPQVLGSAYALKGLNTFGDRPAKGPGGQVKSGSGQAALDALQSLWESVLPGARIARLVREGGHPAYDTSTFFKPQPKAGQGTSVLNRIFNPLYGFERAGQPRSGGGRGSGSLDAALGGSGGSLDSALSGGGGSLDRALGGG